MKFNAISGESFTSTRSTSHNNINKKFQWSDSGDGQIDIYIDGEIYNVIGKDDGRKKYCWLLESRTIIPDVFKYVEENYHEILQYCDGIFTCDEELSKISGFLYTISNAAPWVISKDIYPKTKLVSMIASNKSWAEGHRRRLALVDRWRDKLDLYGRGFNTLENKEDGLRNYMFSVAVENEKYDTYFTEKLTDCFACGTVPLYYGSEKVSELFNSDGIIFIDENFDMSILNEELYHSMMPAIEENFKIAQSFPTAEDYIYGRYFNDRV